MTKTSLKFASCLAVLLTAGACGGTSDQDVRDGNVVNVYNWADYISPDVVKQFEAETGIKVNYDLYDSSEVVDVKLLT